ncbi:TetR/AcrR family transcriptional regulator [Flavihumibacter petaseus]|uniref:Putative TetR family transcriptional regulator n=1 Tax=Flavihumibacter petaseus NBRC 106054 TaxID=1220578 RepID=A0A0E9MZZ6_9BACT|nr:TetR/AcrR family transcriptional regulator [Flavihumibacter petaseus]GAO43327.1 putative TetR family transcriptional regulator [Flavihumibacter petaseus NBRC 106054]
MAIKDSNTEKQIVEAARHIFFKEGRFKATTQEIADAAGVTRTLLNYYFRSRDVLFEKILQDARENMDAKLKTVMEGSSSFREKIEYFIDVFIEQSLNLPYIDAYMISRMNDGILNPDEVVDKLATRDMHTKVKRFLKEIETEIEKGTIPHMTPLDFMVNLSSLLAYPGVAQPMFKKIFQMSDKQYRQFLAQRKAAILKALFK